MNNTNKFSKLQLRSVTQVQHIQTVLIFRQNLPEKGIPGLNKKNRQHHRIQHIRNLESSKFHLKQSILIFWTKFAEKNVSGVQ